MHVLPLPFGLALALLPRREADKFRRPAIVQPRLPNPISARDRILSDIRYFNPHA
jgi:hypothetical protein